MSSSSSRRVAVLAAAAYLAAAGFAVWLSLDSKLYFFHDEADRAAWRYEPRPVVLVCLAMLAEVLLVWAALAGWERWPLWGRALAAGVVLTPWALFCSIFIVHAPGFIMWHVIWVWGLWMVLAGSVVLSLGGAGARWLSRRRRHARRGVGEAGGAA